MNPRQGGQGAEKLSERIHHVHEQQTRHRNRPKNARKADGRTARNAAAQSGRTDIVKALVEKDADVNVKASNGATALSVASGFGHVEVAKLLLDKGAKTEIKDINGAKALPQFEFL